MMRAKTRLLLILLLLTCVTLPAAAQDMQISPPFFSELLNYLEAIWGGVGGHFDSEIYRELSSKEDDQLPQIGPGMEPIGRAVPQIGGGMEPIGTNTQIYGPGMEPIGLPQIGPEMEPIGGSLPEYGPEMEPIGEDVPEFGPGLEPIG